MAETLGIVASIAGLITLTGNTLTLISSLTEPETQTRRIKASLKDLAPMLVTILKTLQDRPAECYEDDEEMLIAPVVALFAVLRRLEVMLQKSWRGPVKWLKRKEEVAEMVAEIETAKTTLILALVSGNLNVTKDIRESLQQKYAHSQQQQLHDQRPIVVYRIIARKRSRGTGTAAVSSNVRMKHMQKRRLGADSNKMREHVL